MLDGVLANMPLPGELLAEKYRVERVIGAGGMGVVFAVTHVHLRERFALKLLRPAAMADPDNVSRFMREGRAAVKIRSRHVARVFDVGTLADATPYLVMEYLEGADFGELLEGRQSFAIVDAVDWILQACEAVAEAHAAGIVHRDLKPSNLFLAEQADGPPIIKVLDFGISKMSANDSELAMTRTSSILGSPLYMSPEQLKSARDVDMRSDIWSIGVILHQWIAGRPPFFASSVAELCALVLSNEAPWLAHDAPKAPAELAAIVATCLRSDPAERYANLTDFADAIAKFGGKGARASVDRITEILGMPAKRAVPFTLERLVAARSTKTTGAGAWTAPNDRPMHGRRFGWLGALALLAIGVFVGRQALRGEASVRPGTEPALQPVATSPLGAKTALSSVPVPVPVASSSASSASAEKPALVRGPEPRGHGTAKPAASSAPTAEIDRPPPAPSTAVPARSPLGAATSPRD